MKNSIVPNKKHIFHYFIKMHKKALMAQESCLFLPSALSLAHHLNCTALDIHETMTDLMQKGYQFLNLDLDTPITVLVQSA